MTTAAGATLCAAARDDQELLQICPSSLRPSLCGAESIVIYLTAPGISVMPMRVMASDSIASVKLRVQTSRGFVVRKQKLVFDGRELARNDCCIRDYGVSDGNVLHLVIRISDLRLITVETVQGNKFRFRVEPGRTVGYVKQQIAKDRLHPAHPDDQSLVLQGEVLDDSNLIHDVCRSDGAVIHLLVHRSAKLRTRPVDRDFEVSIVARNAGEIHDHSPKQQTKLQRDFAIEPVVVNPKAALPSVIDNLVNAVFSGMEKGNAPIMSSEGTGGAYFMQDASGQEHVAVFKPVDEEPMAANNPRGLPPSPTGEGLKKGTRVGEGAIREVAAYILDHPPGARRSFSRQGAAVVGFAGVAPTALVRCMHRSFKQPPCEHGKTKQQQQPVFKVGSLQAFVKNSGSCEDMGPREFPVQEVHKICVLDIRLANADRHAGNILTCREEGRGLCLVPIDHGYCLPESFEDCTFEWLYWAQCREPFSEETVEYIRALDADEDIAILRFHTWEVPAKCARVLRITTMLLKKGVERGLTAFDMGTILCRATLTEESVIEEIIHEAEADGAIDDEAAFLNSVSESMDRRLDGIKRARESNITTRT
ncbi:phosphatidylinositol 4-kinase gamma 4-like [Oryza brachyantha]|uniref:1-phosphatidylinositol 4-kinase n=1 Tax=Oryza brachyantha TaxID=4533 RepID=J3MAB1_ORYBR|nr:phosphatidylinositol 4-kinase gamma 4-like [Oryza brachyantha]